MADSPDEIKLRMGAGNPVAGKDKSALCQGCHGEDGNSTTPSFSKLAGQHAAYIQKQIHDFQVGKQRKDPIMSSMAATVTGSQDLLDIAAYFASQKQMKGGGAKINAAGRQRFLDDNGCVNCHGENGKAPNNPKYPVIGGMMSEQEIEAVADYVSGL